MLGIMANMHKEKQRCVRGIPQDTWDNFGVIAESIGTDRSRLVHAFICWYLKEPESPFPERPE